MSGEIASSAGSDPIAAGADGSDVVVCRWEATASCEPPRERKACRRPSWNDAEAEGGRDCPGADVNPFARTERSPHPPGERRRSGIRDGSFVIVAVS